MYNVFDSTLYLIALINPMSKVFILWTLSKQASPRELRIVAFKSSATALGILLVFAFAGHAILSHVFHVEVYSLKVAAGLVLFFVGYTALSKGVFFEMDAKHNLEEVSVVPLSSPMIAGPATITAAISLPAELGLPTTCIALIMALAVNLLTMLASGYIGHFLSRYNLMGALIRITGLIVATIAVQMTFMGLGEWYAKLR